jgi:glycosyltransferase involved in cell wall biosynthesis
MMTELGHTVFFYGSPQDEGVICHQFIPCIRYSVKGEVFDPKARHWRIMGIAAYNAIWSRKISGDFLCIIGGTCQKALADKLPDLTCVEYAVGYGGTFAQFRVFESVVWQHTVYGADAQRKGNVCDANVNFYDAAIPHAFDKTVFPTPVQKKDNYFLYVGRMASRKGLSIAIETCKRLSAKLILAGPPGDFTLLPEHGEYLGIVTDEKKMELMRHARAVFCPTTYIEPFGCVSVEARFCGTPVLATPAGAYAEHVVDGVDGFLCHELGEWIRAAAISHNLDVFRIVKMAQSRFDIEVVKPMYQRYFERLSTLKAAGWYTV